jgi:hypothetical protein
VAHTTAAVNVATLTQAALARKPGTPSAPSQNWQGRRHDCPAGLCAARAIFAAVQETEIISHGLSFFCHSCNISFANFSADAFIAIGHQPLHPEERFNLLQCHFFKSSVVNARHGWKGVNRNATNPSFDEDSCPGAGSHPKQQPLAKAKFPMRVQAAFGYQYCTDEASS